MVGMKTIGPSDCSEFELPKTRAKTAVKMIKVEIFIFVDYYQTKLKKKTFFCLEIFLEIDKYGL